MNRFTCVLASIIIILTSANSYAHDAGDWLARIRGIYVVPNDHSGSLSTVPNSGVKVSNSATGELDFTYMWTRNIGTELILATTKHNLRGTGTLSGVKVGSTWVLPPTLLLQYHLFPCNCFQPYLGVGINWSLFWNEHCSLAETHLKLRNSWGVAGQVGFDYMINKCWFFNADVKYVLMDTRATLTGATTGHVHVDINPWIFGVGIGRRF